VKLLDASTIDLCLSVFQWAKFRQKKGAIKLHVEYDLGSQIPTFVSLTDGKVSDITEARKMFFEKGSILVFDRGYVDYCWYNQLNTQGVFFLTRLKKNMKFRVVERKKVLKKFGITSDQIIRVTGTKEELIPCNLRRIRYVNSEDNQEYIFITNIMHLSAPTIADLYKARWDIELFFKWIKQNLKINTFLGTSKNAVMSQIWSALCLYLILKYIQYACRIDWTIHKMLVVLRFNVFEKVSLYGMIAEYRLEKCKTKFVQYELVFL
jgi:putative transposase